MSRRPKIPAAKLLDVTKRWLVLADDLFPIIPLVVAVANRLPNAAPVWLLIIAPPSTGKTEIVDAISGLKGVHRLSNLTPKTLASGYKPELHERRTHFSLLDRIKERGEWLITIKEFGTMVSDKDAVKKIMAQLREVYDGTLDVEFGTGQAVNWRGKLGLIAAATPKIERVYSVGDELGERFLFFRPRVPDPRLVASQAAENAGHSARQKKHLMVGVKRAFKDALAFATQPRSPASRAAIAKGAQGLALFVSAARRAVYRTDYLNEDDYELGVQEMPARLVGQFSAVLAAALAVFYGDMDSALRVAARLAADSMPGKRAVILRLIALSPDGITVEQAQRGTEGGRNAAHRELMDLEALGFVAREKPAKTEVYKASPKLLGLAHAIWPEVLSSEAALQKLFDVSAPSPSEEEKTDLQLGEAAGNKAA